jgi:hypothetical protein
MKWNILLLKLFLQKGVTHSKISNHSRVLLVLSNPAFLRAGGPHDQVGSSQKSGSGDRLNQREIVAPERSEIVRDDILIYHAPDIMSESLRSNLRPLFFVINIITRGITFKWLRIDLKSF